MINKMMNGEMYDPCDEELVSLRKKCHNLCREYNSLSEDNPRRNEILKELGINELVKRK